LKAVFSQLCFNHHFPPGLAGCHLDFQSPVIFYSDHPHTAWGKTLHIPHGTLGCNHHPMTSSLLQHGLLHSCE